jgi:hypothetical protein
VSDDKYQGPGQEPAGGKTAEEQRGEYLAALEYEKSGYKACGLADRAKAVDAQIKKLTADAKPAPQSTRAED